MTRKAYLTMCIDAAKTQLKIRLGCIFALAQGEKRRYSNAHEHEERLKVLIKNALVLLNARIVGKPYLGITSRLLVTPTQSRLADKHIVSGGLGRMRQNILFDTSNHLSQSRAYVGLADQTALGCLSGYLSRLPSSTCARGRSWKSHH